MKYKALNHPLRIKADAIAETAGQAVERALAARKAAIELTHKQTQEVSGGLPHDPTTTGVISPRSTVPGDNRPVTFGQLSPLAQREMF